MTGRLLELVRSNEGLRGKHGDWTTRSESSELNKNLGNPAESLFCNLLLRCVKGENSSLSVWLDSGLQDEAFLDFLPNISNARFVMPDRATTFSRSGHDI